MQIEHGEKTVNLQDVQSLSQKEDSDNKLGLGTTMQQNKMQVYF